MRRTWCRVSPRGRWRSWPHTSWRDITRSARTLAQSTYALSNSLNRWPNAVSAEEAATVTITSCRILRFWRGNTRHVFMNNPAKWPVWELSDEAFTPSAEGRFSLKRAGFSVKLAIRFKSCRPPTIIKTYICRVDAPAALPRRSIRSYHVRGIPPPILRMLASQQFVSRFTTFLLRPPRLQSCPPRSLESHAC